MSLITTQFVNDPASETFARRIVDVQTGTLYEFITGGSNTAALDITPLGGTTDRAFSVTFTDFNGIVAFLNTAADKLADKFGVEL